MVRNRRKQGFHHGVNIVSPPLFSVLSLLSILRNDVYASCEKKQSETRRNGGGYNKRTHFRALTWHAKEDDSLSSEMFVSFCRYLDLATGPLDRDTCVHDKLSDVIAAACRSCWSPCNLTGPTQQRPWWKPSPIRQLQSLLRLQTTRL